MRKLLRNIARVEMAKRGLKHFNRKGYNPVGIKPLPSHKSYFALNWRNWCVG